MLKKILSSQTKTERAETQKQVANMGLSKESQKLRFKLLKDLERRNISPQAIKVGKVANIYPIGTRGIYMFAKFGTATDSQKWKLFEYFKKQ
jgi:hypothetical protein